MEMRERKIHNYDQSEIDVLTRSKMVAPSSYLRSKRKSASSSRATTMSLGVHNNLSSKPTYDDMKNTQAGFYVSNTKDIDRIAL